MNEGFPPFGLPAPLVERRRREPSRPVPLPPEVIARRHAISEALVAEISPLSLSLHEMSDEERRAVFYKIKHEGPVPFVGTDLKPIVEPSDDLALAIPRTDNLQHLVEKVRDFGTEPLRRGHAPQEQLGWNLKHIQRGEAKDRLSQALFEQYDALVEEEWVVCEVEMISVKPGRRQQQAELRQIRSELDSAFANGTRGNFFEHEEIKGTCRAVIRCSGSLFREFVEGDRWQLRLVWFDAKPEFETFHSVLRDFTVDRLGPFRGPSASAPVVCVVDSGLNAENRFLRHVTREEMLSSFLRSHPGVPYDEHGHGSGVASLVGYYALNIADGAINEGRIWVASARVLDADNEAEEQRLFSSVLAEVVDSFVPLGVRIFNLSVNILNRKWNEEARRTVPRRSWIARAIDRLSRERDVVFVISTGNIRQWKVREYIQGGKHYPTYFADEDARMFDPGQAALALTVGAVAPGTLAVGSTGSAVAIAARNQPAPFTRCGPGIEGEMKPELVDYGGNYLHDVDGGIVRSNPGTDVLMASHQVTPPICHDSGTSFAAPRVAHRLGVILEDLEAMGVGHVTAPLLKAFAVNSARWEPLGQEFEDFREALDAVAPKHWQNVAGYGVADEDFATYCDEYSALLFYQGFIRSDTIAYFDVPVPASLAEAPRGTKRLTITVAYSPEVQRWGLETYLGTKLKWRIFRGDVDREHIIAAMSVEEDSDDRPDEETPQRPGELAATLGIMRRSRGTVQHDIIEWSRHLEDYSANHYTLAIAAYERWRRPNPPEMPYAVVVRLEETTGTTHVYSEVQHILTEIEIRTRAGA